MPLCDKCKKFLPPGFVPEGEKICVFCIRDTKTLPWKGEMVSKDDIIKEYDMFLKEVKERNEILRKAVKGDRSDIPEKLILE